MIYALALVLGAVYCLGFAPFDFWPATAVGVAGLFWLLNRRTVKPVWLAWWFGVGKYGLGASWIYVSINVYGNAPPPLAGFLVVIFVTGLALLFCAPLGWLYTRLRTNGVPGASEVIAFTAVWVLMDWISTWLLTGFPWLLPGYAVMQTYLVAWAPVVGVLGTGLLMVLSVTALTVMVMRRQYPLRLGLLFALPWVLGLGLGQVDWVQPGAVQRVALVQGNIDQAVKWRREEAVPNVRKHLRLSAEHWDADILLWPEAAVTMYPQQAQSLLESLGEQGSATKTNIVLGIPGLEVLPDERYEFQNLAIGLGEARGRFAKYHLVPFGEYVPLEGVLRGLIEFFDLPMSSSSPGGKYQPNIQLSMGEASMAICYEIAYPESMRQRSETAAVLMTISNDTWFGASIGPLQHMQIARMRALENGRWLLRATNNGVTGIIDPSGQVAASLPQFEEGVLRGEIAVMQGRTPYSYMAHWPVLVVMLGVFATFAWQRWRPA